MEFELFVNATTNNATTVVVNVANVTEKVIASSGDDEVVVVANYVVGLTYILSTILICVIYTFILKVSSNK